MGKTAVKNLQAYLENLGHIGKYDNPKNGSDCAEGQPMLRQHEGFLKHTRHS
jgi:hypothetical protein